MSSWYSVAAKLSPRFTFAVFIDATIDSPYPIVIDTSLLSAAFSKDVIWASTLNVLDSSIVGSGTVRRDDVYLRSLCIGRVRCFYLSPEVSSY